MKKKKHFLPLLLFSFLICLLSPMIQPTLLPITEVQAKTTLDTPELSSVKAKNSSSITVKWKSVDDADGYRIYRKTAKTEWKSIKTITNPKTLSYTNKNLMMGEKYYYTVSAYKLVDGKKKYSNYNTSGLSARTIIPATEKITVTATGNTTTQVEWTPVEGVDGYRVARRASDGEWTILAEISGETNTSFSDSGLKTGRKYYYRIRPYKIVNQKQEWGKYDKSGVSVFTQMTTPKLVSIASPSSKTVTFTWKATPGVDGYLIYRKTNNGSWTKVKNIKNGNTTSFTEDSLAYNTLYHYTVKAYTIEEGEYHTSSRNKTGLKIVTKAASIKKVTAKEASTSSIEITWPKLANVDGYRIYRGKTNGSFTKLADVSGENTLSYLDKTAKMGVTYYYSVRGYKLVDDEKLLGYLNKNGVRASIAVPAPKMISATAVTYDSIQVTWKKVKYADSYALYRKVASSDEWTKIQTFKGNDILSYTDTGLKSSTKYSYAVKSIKKTENGNVYSKRSSSLSAVAKGYMKVNPTSIVLYTGERANIHIETNYSLYDFKSEAKDSSIIGCYPDSARDNIVTYQINGRKAGKTTLRIYPGVAPDDYIDISVTVLNGSTTQKGFEKMKDYLKRNGIFKNGIYELSARESSGSDTLWHASISYEEKTNTFIFYHKAINLDQTIAETTMRLSPDRASESTVQAEYRYSSPKDDAVLTANVTIPKETFNLVPATLQLMESDGFSNTETESILEKGSKAVNSAFFCWSFRVMSPLLNTHMTELGFPSYNDFNR